MHTAKNQEAKVTGGSSLNKLQMVKSANQLSVVEMVAQHLAKHVQQSGPMFNQTLLTAVAQSKPSMSHHKSRIKKDEYLNYKGLSELDLF